MGAILLASAAALTGCDPGVHIGWQKQFDYPISEACILSALRSVTTHVDRGSYLSTGDRGIPKGAMVTQFGYSDPTSRGYYTLDLAALPGGKTAYYHGWGKLGTSVPADERARILPLLYRANRAVSDKCGLSFDDVIPEQGDG